MNIIKNKKIWISIIFFLFSIVSLIYFVNRNTIHTQSLEIAMSVYESNKDEFLQLNTEQNNAKFNLDIAYKTNTEQKMQLYLLCNFKMIPYALNGKAESLVNELYLEASDSIQVSKENQISIHNLNNKKNDMIFLLFSDTMIATKRFQIDNTSTTESVIYEPQIIVKPADIPLDSVYSIEKNNGAIELLVDFSKHIAGSKYEADLIADEILFDSAIVLFSENDKTFELLGYTTHETYKFSMPLDFIESKDNNTFRILIFPFPYNFNTNLLNSYKATLWSNPVITQKFKIGE